MRPPEELYWLSLLSLLVSPVFHDAHTSLATSLINSQESEETILLIFLRGILVKEDGSLRNQEILPEVNLCRKYVLKLWIRAVGWGFESCSAWRSRDPQRGARSPICHWGSHSLYWAGHCMRAKWLLHCVISSLGAWRKLQVSPRPEMPLGVLLLKRDTDYLESHCMTLALVVTKKNWQERTYWNRGT